MNFGGWVNDPKEVERVVSTLSTPELIGTPINGTWDGKTSYFAGWFEEKVVGRRLPIRKQRRGVCVSKGFGLAAEDALILDIGLRGENEEWKYPVADEPIYAGSRVEIGGGRISGDGSVGAWAAKWILSRGLLYRTTYQNGSETVDLATENDDLAARWGAPGRGVPDWLEAKAKDQPVKDVSLVTTFQQMADAAANGYDVAVCSMQGFAMRRDSLGFCAPSGTWAHCMCFRGVVVVKGNRPAVVCRNSWGDYLGGDQRVELEDGRELVLDGGTFLVRPEICDKMLGQRDSFVVSGTPGFQRQDLSWVFA